MLFMPRTTTKPKPLNLGSETIGERIARLRKQHGYTQAELADEMGIIQKLISDYERGRIRPHPEMLARFAVTFDVTTDELIGLKRLKAKKPLKNRRLQLRLNRVGELSKNDQETIIRMIDSLLKNGSASA